MYRKPTAPAKKQPKAPPKKAKSRGPSELPTFTFKRALPGQPSWAWGRARPVGPGPEQRRGKAQAARVQKAAKPDAAQGLNQLFRARHEQELALAQGDIEGYRKKTKKFEQTHKKLKAAGILGAPKKGFLGGLARGVQDIQNAAIYAPYGIYGAGKAIGTDEWRMLQGKAPTETPKLGKAIALSTASDLRHPGRHPGNVLLDALAVLSAGAGSVSRVGAAGSAFREAGVAGEAERAASAAGAAPRYSASEPFRAGGKFAKKPPLVKEVAKMEQEFKKNREYGLMKANLRAQEKQAPSLGTRLKAAVSRPGHEGGSLRHLPIARETPLTFKGQVVAHRLEPDNPLLRPIHASHAKQLQKHLDAIADGKDIPKGKIADTMIALMGGAQKVVGREVRATGRVSKDLGDTFEARLPEGIVPKDAAPPPGEVAKYGRAFNRPFRVFGVYLAPKYIATNLTGNMTMGVATQGVAKISANMYRARRITATHGEDLAHDIRGEVGISRTESTIPGSEMALHEEQQLSMMPHAAEEAPKGTLRQGYRTLENRAVRGVMAITDRDFRTASWLYRARERGFKTPEQQRALIHDPKHARARDSVARKSRKDAVDFNSLTPKEKALVEGVYFYPWLSRATAWTGRTVANRPIKSAALANLAVQGKAQSQRDIGDAPEWSRGYIKTPWGFVNPKSVFTPSTPADVATQIRHPAKNLLAQPGASIEPGSSFAEEFGTPALGLVTGQSLRDLGAQIAPVGALNRLGHPLPIVGKPPGKTFPETGVKPALGPLMFGGLYPRKGKTQVMHEQAARERFRAASPMQRLSIKTDERKQKIPIQVAALKKRGIPTKDLVGRYKGDLDAYQHREEFKLQYAQRVGASSYRQMPPGNKVEAALAYLKDHSHLSDETIRQMAESVKYLKSDADLNTYANSLWSATGIGQYKSSWDSLVKTLPKHTKKLK